MGLWELYVVLLESTATSFGGLASLPLLHDALVTNAHVLSDQQLHEAIVINRSTPGPVGFYVVSIGYFVAGLPGALVGWLAIVTPALAIIPAAHFAGRWIDHPRVKSTLQAVVIASAGLLAATSIPLGRSALTDAVAIVIAVVALAVLLFTRVGSLWIIAAAAVASTAASAAGLISVI